MRGPCVVLTVFLLSCGRPPSLDQAAQALFEGRVRDATVDIRGVDVFAPAGLSADDFIPYSEDELKKLAGSGPATSADDPRRLQITPRGLQIAKEPTFLWESTRVENRVTIRIADDAGDVASFAVPDFSPYTPPRTTLERGKTYRWTLVGLDGKEIADWAEFTIAPEAVAASQLKMLGLLSQQVSASEQRALLAVQFYRHRGLLAEALNNLQYLAKSQPQNPRIRLEMAACLAQLGNSWGAQQFLAGKP